MESLASTKTRRRRIAAGVCTVGMLPTLLGVSPASAADNVFDYTVSNGNAVITKCANNVCPSSMEIPAAIDGDPVVGIANGAFVEKGINAVSFDQATNLASIGNSAFQGNKVQSVTIPAEVSSIGTGAFMSNGLKSVSFETGSKLSTIRTGAFRSNKLSSVAIPASVTEIGSNVFESNSLTDVSFAENSQLVTISQNAFLKNSLLSIEIPASVRTLGVQAFMDNKGLSSVKFLGDKPGSIGADVFKNTGVIPMYYKASTAPSWGNTASISGRPLVKVDDPEITSQPLGGELPSDGSLDLQVEAAVTIQGQGSLDYQWFKDGEEINGATSPTYEATSVGSYRVQVQSWAGSTLSEDAIVSAPVPPTPDPSPTPSPSPAPTPAPKPAPRPAIKKVKKKQSVKVKLPSKLKKNKKYKLPARTKQGRAITWRVKGAGKCKINKKKRTITCKRATGKKKFTLVGTAKASTTLYTYKVTIKRRVR